MVGVLTLAGFGLDGACIGWVNDGVDGGDDGDDGGPLFVV